MVHAGTVVAVCAAVLIALYMQCAIAMADGSFTAGC